MCPCWEAERQRRLGGERGALREAHDGDALGRQALGQQAEDSGVHLVWVRSGERATLRLSNAAAACKLRGPRGVGPAGGVHQRDALSKPPLRVGALVVARAHAHRAGVREVAPRRV